ncbi:amidohydrolase [Sphingobium lactosutens]|uniref:amidohydrolase family protein n=1 Tax=Sphingobium lactosutens TaxID=522773 RepID=UPI0015BA179A|nr:amidohydrolase family protein [Sphingobium lactosutens]NWK94450.1 amidohydrolase [Sphingobium lactosutens]
MGVELLPTPNLFENLAPPLERKPQPAGNIKLPAGSVVVSSDNHWSVADDIFYERFPEHLKDRAPRVRQEPNGAFVFEVDNKSLFNNSGTTVLGTYDSLPGNHRLEPRLRDLDIEGVEKEIVFTNAVGVFYAYPDLEVREWAFKIYNEYLGELQDKAPGRFYGVGLINFWEPTKTAESIAQLKALGIKTLLLPQNPYGADRQPLSYCSPDWEPMWQAIEDSGLPVYYHVGEFAADGPGGVGLTMFVSFGPFRKSLGELIFGGIFDRHPKLRVIFAEADINWIPGALQSADMIYDTFRNELDPAIKHRPSHYWHENCYATFMSDPIGLQMLDKIGADRVMWAMDYPHPESVYGCGWASLKEVMDNVPSEDDVRKIVGGTALKLFGL